MKRSWTGLIFSSWMASTVLAQTLVRVADAIFDAIRDGRFHAWPDSMAKEIGAAYQSFAENVVEADMAEA